MVPLDLSLFADLPISEPTKLGLKQNSYVLMTDIQMKSLPVSLKGRDVLGAARTGSGKTLAFLVPVLEILHRRKWGPTDGLGSLIISPTRELAVQIFEVLRSIGKYHSFSAGLVIGGKNLKSERDRLSRMNILVATPGRLLQHMDQTVAFDADNLQILVLDEADRILDMGFQRTLTALLNHLPKSRQTLLFSATQTQSVSDLARLSLKDPAYIGVSEAGTSNIPLPPSLEQHYLITALDNKLDALWSFIKTHLQSKILVFLSSCKQVCFVFKTFCKMHPGIPLLQLHGKQKQSARLMMYDKFTTTSHSVLFATDIAARGLDFPGVDWVVQVDAPEDANTYVHRVGRTARYESKGKALLFLLPSEEDGMKAALAKKNIEVQKIRIRRSKTQSIENQLQKFAFQDPEIKYLGQRAFVSYLRSIYLHKDKSIFKLDELPVERFAQALGLPGVPKITFYNRELAKKKKNLSRFAEETQVVEAGAEVLSGASVPAPSDSEAVNNAAKPLVRTKYDRMFERKNRNILSVHYAKLVDHETEDEDEDEDFITLKRAGHDLLERGASPDPDDLSKRKKKLGRAKRTIAKGGVPTKLVFDGDGQAHNLYELADGEAWIQEHGGVKGVEEDGKRFAEDGRGKMRVADVLDKQEAREKKREKKRKRKETESEEVKAVKLMPLSDDDGYVSPELDLPSESEEEGSRPSKRRKDRDLSASGAPTSCSYNLQDDEDLALKLLQKR